jgi:hypothetical protein
MKNLKYINNYLYYFFYSLISLLSLAGVEIEKPEFLSDICFVRGKSVGKLASQTTKTCPYTGSRGVAR